MDFEKQISEDLYRYLLSEGKVDQRLPECPDVEELWQPIAKAYLPDGIREFAQYPITSLGWMMFIGMAVAWMWDEDWERHSKDDGATIYARLRDAKGFDALDDHILDDILNLSPDEAAKTAAIVGECAARTLSALQHSGIEPGTAEASRAYIASLHALYTMGVAVELKSLGYHMTPINLN